MTKRDHGDVTITLGGNEYTLRPTFDALVEFEERAGVTVYGALRNVVELKSAPLRSMAAAFAAGIKATWTGSGKPPAYQEVGQMIRSAGISNYLQAYAEFLTNALTSDTELKEAQGNEQAGN
jgi:hypothetical protein